MQAAISNKESKIPMDEVNAKQCQEPTYCY
jgi:hypothetical protein